MDILIGTKNHSSTTSKKPDQKKSKSTPLEAINFCTENERIKHRYFDRVIHRFGKNKDTLQKIYLLKNPN
jgi:hypothetical protein